MDRYSEEAGRLENHPWQATGRPYGTWETVDQMLLDLQDGQGIEFNKLGWDVTVKIFNIDEFLELNNRVGVSHLVSIALRKGCGEFFNTLETQYFEPDTPANNNFEFRYFKWFDLLFIVATIPQDSIRLAQSLAEEMGFTLRDTIPATLRLGGRSAVAASIKPETQNIEPFEFFPVRENVYTLEGEGHGQ